MKILIADDHQLFLDGFSFILNKLDQSVDVLPCTNADEAIEMIEQHPDINLIVLDLSMPGLDGLSLMRKIQQRAVLAPIVFVSANENIGKIKQVMDAGAFGFIPKQSDSGILLKGLKQVLNGEIYLPDDIVEKLSVYGKGGLGDDPMKYYKLSPRQMDVLRLISSGCSNKEISSQLGITEPTVKSHISVLFQALDVNNRMSCVKNAEKIGLL